MLKIFHFLFVLAVALFTAQTAPLFAEPYCLNRLSCILDYVDEGVADTFGRVSVPVISMVDREIAMLPGLRSFASFDLAPATESASGVRFASLQDDGEEPVIDEFDFGPFNPLWTGTIEALVLDRSAAGNVPLVRSNGAGMPILITGATPRLGVAGGPRVSIRRHFESGRSLEIVYFGIDGWSSTQSVPGSVTVLGPNVNFAVGVGSTAIINYTSALDSFEANWWHPWNDWLDVGLGFRMMELNEFISAEGEFGGGPMNLYNIRTRNYLYGLQFVADGDIWTCENGLWELDAFLKAGIFGNQIRQGTTVNQGEWQFANNVFFFGEIGIKGYYHWSENLSLYMGYQAAWLVGVALAPEQVPVTNAAVMPITTNFDLGGMAFYHGAFAGLEFRL